MILEVNNLVKRYGDLLAVDKVNLRVKEGEIFGLLGPNGAGKTTVINLITGLTKLDKGEIKVFEKDLNHNEMIIKKDIGVVPQDIAVFEELSAYENVTFFAKLYGLKGALLNELVEEALNFTGLWERRKEYPKKYSGGMKRRLNIACAIVHQPKLIIMDEPTVGIDPQSRNHILNSVRELNQKGSTVIYTSHYMEEIEELCSYVAIMDHGRVIAEGTIDDLKAMISFEDKVKIDLNAVNYTMTEKIKALAGVKEVVVEDNSVTVISQKDSKNLGRIIDKVIEANGQIVSLSIDKPTLEGVFLTLTGRTLRDS